MAFKLKILISFLVIVSLSISGHTATNDKSKVKKKPKDPGQTGYVKVDGAAVYEVANFDSPVLEYLDSGKKVLVSKKIYPGIGGLGTFYKVRLRKGVYGYLTDTDVEVKGRRGDKDDDENADLAEDDEGREEGHKDPTVLDERMEKDDDGGGEDSFYMRRYVGLAFSNVNYAEVLRNTREVANVSMFGLKLSGPTSIMGGIPLDVNFLITSTAPAFYTEIASSTSGFMFITDAAFTVPLYESRRFMLYYGAGLAVRYSSWDVKLKTKPTKAPVASEEVAAGAVALGGVAARFGKRIAVRADARYYYEKEAYLAFGGALQFNY